MFRQKFLFKRFFVIFINILTNLIIVFAFYSCASDLSLDAYLDALPCNQENPVYDLMYICTWRHVCMFSACYQDQKQCGIIHLVYAKYVWLNLIAAFKKKTQKLADKIIRSRCKIKFTLHHTHPTKSTITTNVDRHVYSYVLTFIPSKSWNSLEVRMSSI